MARQFPNVSGRYGAPMGRHTAPDLDTSPRSVRLFAVRLDSGGYDDGGAYWGLRQPGERLWCAIDKDGDMQFTDAPSRTMAAFLLDVPIPALIIEPKGWREYMARMHAAGDDSVPAYMDACAVVERESLPPYRIGQRVQLSPATDAWMRGDRFGDVVRVSKAYVVVKMDRSGRKLRVARDYLEPA